MRRQLPERPSLSSLRNQAKALLKAHRLSDGDARARLAEHHPRPPRVPGLKDAQLALAREYGFKSWAKLKAHVEGALVDAMSAEERVDAFLESACLTYQQDDGPARLRKAHHILERSPEVASANIYTAAATGDLATAERLLAADEALATARGGPRDQEPLLYLCYSRVGQSDAGRDPVAVARLLLARGASPNSCFLIHGYRFTALTGAFGEGEGGVNNQPPHPQARALASLLLEAGADPNDSQGLYNTCFTPGNEWLELLLEYGLSKAHQVNWPVDKPQRMLDFLLGHAAKNGFTQRVALLLEHGADPNAVDYYDGRPPYRNALRGGFAAVTELLTRHGADPGELTREEAFQAAVMRADGEASRSMLRESPELIREPMLLRDAAFHGRADAVELLLGLGADSNATPPDGIPALNQAARRGHLEIAKRLVEAGARLDTRDAQFNGTPIGWARHGGQDAVLAWLLEHTHDVFDLVAHGRLERLEPLLRENPTLATARDGSGNTPLHYLREDTQDPAAVIELLLACGAEREARNDAGHTPLDVAKATGAADVADLLEALTT